MNLTTPLLCGGPVEELKRRLPLPLAQWASELVAAHLCYGVDPLLLAAIVDRESQGGLALRPPGPAGLGDGGHGHGLGQIDDHTHGSFLLATADDGVPLWTEPGFNLLYAARLMRHNLEIFYNEVPLALAAYNAGVRRVRDAIAKLPHTANFEDRAHAADSVTTGGNYSTDVLRRKAAFTT